MSNALVLLDESGDLGWKFDQPYRQGGSSRFFTIAATIGIDNGHRHTGSLIRSLGKQYSWTSGRERKWTDLGTSVRRSFASVTVEMLKKHSDVQCLVGVVDKHQVPEHVRGHFHLFYAWMASSLLAPSLRTLRTVSICPDELNAGNGNEALLESALRKDLWFHLRCSTTVNRIARNTSLENGLAFCDYLAGSFQSHFQDGDSVAYEILKRHVYLHRPMR